MSSNLLKMGFTSVQDTEARVIDTNDLVAKRIEALMQKMAQEMAEEEMAEDEESSADGFSAGLSAELVEGLLLDEESEEGSQSNVIKAGPTPEELEEQRLAEQSAQKEKQRDELLAETKGAADMLLADALQKARTEAERIKVEARVEIEAERQEALAQAREQGYAEGYQQAQAEFEARQQELEAWAQGLQAQMEDILSDLEPRMVEAIGDAYEYIIGAELSGYRDVLIYMIASAVRKIESSKEFVIHVSEEDHPYVSMERKQLEAALSTPGATIEIVPDDALNRNECRIETESGVFDCGLEAQMSELKKKLKLLSYEKS